MTSRSTATSRRSGTRLTRLLAVACALAVGTLLPLNASAELTSIAARPERPTVCDSVALLVAGTVPNPCYTVLWVFNYRPRPLDTAGPIPVYEIRVKATIQEPNPIATVVCPTVIQPYERELRLGRLPFGQYIVNAVEYFVPYTEDSSSIAYTDSTHLTFNFFVAHETCPPGPGCYNLSFGSSDPSPPSDSVRVDQCDASVRPGSTGCFDVDLFNEVTVGGIQTEIVVNSEWVEPYGGPLVHFRPTSVEVVGRASGFKVAWSAVEGSRVKILVFSTDGAAIPPGRGAILHVCYSVAADTPEGRYPMFHYNKIAADPNGTEIPECLTFAAIVGHICVAKTECDLNGDGVSNIRDVMLLVNCALDIPGLACPDSVFARADCNADGSLDVRDVICCVRKILNGGGFGSGGGSGDPGAAGNTRIGFDARPVWINSETGRASIQIQPGDGFGGIQFAVNPTGGARVRSLALLEAPGGVSLEWAVQNGLALAMLYRIDPTAGPSPSKSGGAAGAAVRVEVSFEAIPGSQDAATLSLEGVGTATTNGAAAPTSIDVGSVDVPTSPAASTPTVSVPTPNPFASETAINYALPTSHHVTIRVYDVNGRLVRTLVDATMPAGSHTAQWDGRDAGGRDLGSGIYFFKFMAGGVEKTDRLLKLR